MRQPEGSPESFPSLHDRLTPIMDRRSFLTVIAGSALLAACGGGDQQTAATTVPADGLATMRFMAEPSVLTGPDRRIVFGLADLGGGIRVDGTPTIEGMLLLGGLIGQVEMICYAREVALLPAASPATVKKHFAGSGSAQKPQIMAACDRRGWAPQDADAADALAVLDWGVHRWHGRKG